MGEEGLEGVEETEGVTVGVTEGVGDTEGVTVGVLVGLTDGV